MQTLTIKQASAWAANYIGKNVTAANIAYLIQYGRVKKIECDDGIVRVAIADLQEYYNLYNREQKYKQKLGDDLNWALSFEQYKEAETTKHVHRLHPYKGKFIPQLAEYFLDAHIDNFKKEAYFRSGDIVLDPFCGSGTMLVQACELGINAIGIDISAFNALMSNSKVKKYNLLNVQNEINAITSILKAFLANNPIMKFEAELTSALSNFNNKYFPANYKYRLRQGEIDEKQYGSDKEKDFLPIYNNLCAQYKIKLLDETADTFLKKWYIPHVYDEITAVHDAIKNIEDADIRNIISVILSRTIRSCRATTHADLATLQEPIAATYYCAKHGKICKPLFSILKWWETYTKDTIKRLGQFDKLRTNTFQLCLAGDSRSINILEEVKKHDADFAHMLEHKKINGIFSSPPYIGLIDYHQQHAYAYDLFGLQRNDHLEIGPLSKGQTKDAQQNYICSIADVLNNCKQFLIDDYNIFLVANDKFNMYPTIAASAGMKIVNQFCRPVLNRSEKDKTAYSETIFHLKEN
jgi:hypothetical protein